MKSLEARLDNIETMLKKLIEEKQLVWISEAKAMEMLGRSREWLRRERLGINGVCEPTLIEGSDWRRVNGRTPEYRAKSIEYRKTITRQKTSA